MARDIPNGGVSERYVVVDIGIPDVGNTAVGINDKSQRAQQTTPVTGDEVPLLKLLDTAVPSVENIDNNSPGRLSKIPSVNSNCQAADGR